ncbi:MAG: hypothetical protein PHE67_02570 [Campylobacterales bacterium]|nr:hypothetical protein [Campylobacterales bacterium]
MKLSWLEEVEFDDLLEGDTALIAEYCGLDTLKKLWEVLPSVNLYISTKPLDKAKKRYIQKNFDGTNIKKLAVELEVSEKFVQDALDQPKIRTIPQPKLFD